MTSTVTYEYGHYVHGWIYDSGGYTFTYMNILLHIMTLLSVNIAITGFITL